MWKILYIIILLVGDSICGDYKRFRSEKINYIYDKALRHISDKKRLIKLENELSSFDGIYMSTKDLHATGKVSGNGKEMAKIDEKLLVALDKYGLQQTVQAFKEKMKHKNEHLLVEENSTTADEKFTDERLQKLWMKAKEEAKFTPSELEELHKQLKEAEVKTNVYEDALTSMNKVGENSVHFDEHDIVHKKNKALKKAFVDVEDHLDYLHQQVANKTASVFEDDKVRKLWKLAQTNQNFTANDLSIVKEELLHFDKQLKKIAFHKNEIDKTKELHKELDDGKESLYHIENSELEAKHEKMTRKMRKLEKYLEQKIVHSEL